MLFLVHLQLVSHEVECYLHSGPLSTVAANHFGLSICVQQWITLGVQQQVESCQKFETAHRLLSICSQTFRYAVRCGKLAADPTRDLAGVLQRPRVKHMAAFTKPEEIAPFLLSVDGYKGSMIIRIAIRIGIYTFVRPGNLREAEWSEFRNLNDPKRAEWRIPGRKMKVKTERDFVVPLAPQVVKQLAILKPLTGKNGGRYLFPSARTSTRPMSENAVTAALRAMGYSGEEVTGHGFRAMARTVCHEQLRFPVEVIEEQLAHGKPGPLGGAYDRTEHLSERRRMMCEYAIWLGQILHEYKARMHRAAQPA